MADNGKDTKVLTVEAATADLLAVIKSEVQESKNINERVKALNAKRGAAQAALTQAVAHVMEEDERKPSASATTLTEVPQPKPTEG